MATSSMYRYGGKVRRETVVRRFCVPVIAARVSYTGELGFEIFCHPRDALAVWDAVQKAGQPRGLRPLGLEALAFANRGVTVARRFGKYKTRSDIGRDDRSLRAKVDEVSLQHILKGVG